MEISSTPGLWLLLTIMSVCRPPIQTDQTDRQAGCCSLLSFVIQEYLTRPDVHKIIKGGGGWRQPNTVWLNKNNTRSPPFHFLLLAHFLFQSIHLLLIQKEQQEHSSAFNTHCRHFIHFHFTMAMSPVIEEHSIPSNSPKQQPPWMAPAIIS